MCKYLHSMLTWNLLDIYLGRLQQLHIEDPLLIYWETLILTSIVTDVGYILTSSAYFFLSFVYNFSSICWYLFSFLIFLVLCFRNYLHSDLSDIKSQLALIWIYFEANKVEQFTLHLLAICSLSFESCSFTLFVHLLIELF